jgi:hypothetical protein
MTLATGSLGLAACRDETTCGLGEKMITKAELIAFPLIKTAFVVYGQKTQNVDNVSFFLEDSTEGQALYNKYFSPDAALQLNFDSELSRLLKEAAIKPDWKTVKLLIDGWREIKFPGVIAAVWKEFIETVEYETALYRSLVKNPVVNAANLKAAKDGEILKAEVYPPIKTTRKRAILVIGDKSTPRKGHLAKETSWIDKVHSANKKVGTVKITKGGGLLKDKEKGKGSLEFSSTLKPYLAKLQPVLAEFSKKQVI